MGETPRELSILLVTFLSVIVLAPLVIDLFAMIGLALLGERLMSMHPWLWAVTTYLPILAVLLVYLKATLDPLSRYGLRYSDEWIGRSVLIGVASAIVIFAIDASTGTLGSFIDPQAQTTLVGALGFLLAWGVLAPFTEELLFRGTIQELFSEKLEPRHGAWAAILIAVALEMLWHLSVPLLSAAEGELLATVGATTPQLVYVAIFGALSGWVYSKTKSLLGPFLIHAIGNAGELLLVWMLL